MNPETIMIWGSVLFLVGLIWLERRINNLFQINKEVCDALKIVDAEIKKIKKWGVQQNKDIQEMTDATDKFLKKIRKK